jgi:hypothetical protein
MKRTVITALGFVVLFASLAAAQQAQPNPPAAGQNQARVGPNFVDADGDGICDLQATRAGQKRGRGYGPGDGTGNHGAGPKDGTGYGAMSGAGKGQCTGNCTGTGPQGQGRGYRGGRN